MRKFLLGIMAIAMLAIIPATASADVARCEASVPVNTTITTATFNIIQPAGEAHQWNRVFTHTVNVTVNPDRSFQGADTIMLDGALFSTDGVTGSLNADGTMDLNAVRSDGSVSWKLDDAKTDGTTVNLASTAPFVSWDVEMKVSAPNIVTDVTETPGTESVKNHGQFVKAQGGGKTAAQACAGMPLNSTQGGSILK